MYPRITKIQTVTLCVFIFCGILFFGCKKPACSNCDFTDAPYTLKDHTGFPPPYIPSDNALTEKKVYLGRMLFYDPILSRDSSISCASCHKQKFAFGDSTSLSTNIFGPTKRKTMALINLVFQNSKDSFFWDGRAASIEAAVKDAMKGEQDFDVSRHGYRIKNSSRYIQLYENIFGTKNVTEDNISKAIAAFIRTLVSADSKVDKGAKEGDPYKYLNPSERRGYQLYIQDMTRTSRGADCIHCHGDFSNLRFTINTFKNNGLDTLPPGSYGFTDIGLGKVTGKQADNGKFKIPTMRNSSYKGAFMHDGRLKTIDDVINHYDQHVKGSPTLDPQMHAFPTGGLHMTAQEIFDLKNFILALDDPSFVTDTAFSNPFK